VVLEIVQGGQLLWGQEVGDWSTGQGGHLWAEDTRAKSSVQRGSTRVAGFECPEQPQSRVHQDSEFKEFQSEIQSQRLEQRAGGASGVEGGEKMPTCISSSNALTPCPPPMAFEGQHLQLFLPALSHAPTSTTTSARTWHHQYGSHYRTHQQAIQQDVVRLAQTLTLALALTLTLTITLTHLRPLG